MKKILFVASISLFVLFSCSENKGKVDENAKETVVANLRKKAVIDDPDGYVNVREKESKKSKIVAKIAEGEEFYYRPTDSDWWEVAETADGDILGYVHNSRIKPIKDSGNSNKVTEKKNETNKESSHKDVIEEKPKQKPTRSLYTWQCSQCGQSVQSTTQPGSSTSDPCGMHRWNKMGERPTRESDEGVYVWNCRNCGEIVQSSSQPSSSTNDPCGMHRWDKIGQLF